MRIKIRNIVQLLFFILIALIAINHSLDGTGKSIPFISTASLHAVCPLGSVVSIFNLATFGSFQGFLSKIGKKLKVYGKITIPKSVDKYLRFFTVHWVAI